MLPYYTSPLSRVTYKITYNTGNTLTLSASSYYLKGTFNNWEATDAFAKTGNDDVLVAVKDIPAGTYTFKVHNAGADAWYGNAGTISDTANRWTMDSSSNCAFKATGGTYEFKYEISTNKLSVYKAQTGSAPVPTPTTKTVYVGVIEYITDFVPTLHYWNNSTGLSGDATLTATGETVQYAVGSTYWSNTKQNFKVYKTEIPVEANGMKTFRKSSNDRWAAEDITYAENEILLLFEWGGTYHNTTGSYTPVIPTQPPTEAPTPPPTNPPTEKPIEPAKLLGDVDNDGQVTIMDATLIQMYLAHKTTFTDAQVELADTSKDSVVSIMDATLIQMLIAQLIPEL